MPKITADRKIIWRTPDPCSDCPFNSTGPGRFLRSTLRGRRWKEIIGPLRKGGHFLCHKTTRPDGWDEDSTEYEIVGPELVCAGSIEWQAKRGIESDLMQQIERLILARMTKAERKGRTR